MMKADTDYWSLEVQLWHLIDQPRSICSWMLWLEITGLLFMGKQPESQHKCDASLNTPFICPSLYATLFSLMINIDFYAKKCQKILIYNSPSLLIFCALNRIHVFIPQWGHCTVSAANNYKKITLEKRKLELKIWQILYTQITHT